MKNVEIDKRDNETMEIISEYKRQDFTPFLSVSRESSTNDEDLTTRVSDTVNEPTVKEPVEIVQPHIMLN